jgi:hypothetical protein
MRGGLTIAGTFLRLGGMFELLPAVTVFSAAVGAGVGVGAVTAAAAGVPLDGTGMAEPASPHVYRQMP